jgi:hypothetical protein
MTIIASIQEYLATYSGLKDNAPLWVDYLGPKPTEYAVIPLAGPKIIETYINLGSLRSYPFAFQSMESTADDLERLENSGFFEAFSDWLEAQTLAGTLPALAAGQTATIIEAIGWAYLYRQGESNTGVYQVQCKLTYEQDPPS